MPVNWCRFCSNKPGTVCLDCHNADLSALERAEKMSFDEAMRAQANEDFLIKVINRARELLVACQPYLPQPDSKIKEEVEGWLMDNPAGDDPHE